MRGLFEKRGPLIRSYTLGDKLVFECPACSRQNEVLCSEVDPTLGVNVSCSQCEKMCEVKVIKQDITIHTQVGPLPMPKAPAPTMPPTNLPKVSNPPSPLG